MVFVGFACLVVIVGIIILVGSMVEVEKEREADFQEEANRRNEDYMEALERLVSNPADPDIRQECLELGRRYYSTPQMTWTRKGQREIVPPAQSVEAWIANDIEARVGHLKFSQSEKNDVA